MFLVWCSCWRYGAGLCRLAWHVNRQQNWTCRKNGACWINHVLNSFNKQKPNSEFMQIIALPKPYQSQWRMIGQSAPTPQTIVNGLHLDLLIQRRPWSKCAIIWPPDTATPWHLALTRWGGTIAVAQGDHQRRVANQITQHQHLPSVNANGSTSWSPKVPLMCSVWFILTKGIYLLRKEEGESCHWNIIQLSFKGAGCASTPGHLLDPSTGTVPPDSCHKRCLFLGVLLFKQGNPCEGCCSWQV